MKKNNKALSGKFSITTGIAHLSAIGIVLVMLLVAVSCNESDDDQAAPSGEVLVVATVNESFHQASGAVVRVVLENLGYEVQSIDGPHAEIYPRFQNGEADFFAGSWLPNGHSNYWAEVQNVATQITPLYREAQLFWAVPAYVPETTVSAIADLTSPEAIAVLDQNIQGVVAGSGLMRLSGEVMEAYGLSAAGYQLLEGDVPTLSAHVEEMIAQQQLFVTPLWQPQYLNSQYEFRILEDPEQIFPAPDEAFLLGYQGYEDRLTEEALSAIQSIYIGLDAMSELDYRVNVEDMTPYEAAQSWLADNPEQLNAWLQGQSTDPEASGDALASVMDFISALNASDRDQARALTALNVCYAYGASESGSCGTSFYDWLESDIFGPNARFDVQQQRVNGTTVELQGQWGIGGSTDRDFIYQFTVENGLIQFWRLL